MNINFVKESPPLEEETLQKLRPYVAQWFKEAFGEMTPPQKYAIPLIHEDKSTLIFSPTSLVHLFPALTNGVVDASVPGLSRA